MKLPSELKANVTPVAINATNDLDHLTLQEAARRSSLSVSFLRRHLHSEDRPLPHLRMGRKILVDRLALGRWLGLFADQTVQESEVLLTRFKRDFPA